MLEQHEKAIIFEMLRELGSAMYKLQTYHFWLNRELPEIEQFCKLYVALYDKFEDGEGEDNDV